MSNIKVFKSGFGVCSINIDKIVHIKVYRDNNEDNTYKHTVIAVFLENDDCETMKVCYNLEDVEKEAEFFKNFNILLNSNIGCIDVSDSNLCETILNGSDGLVSQEIESIDDLVSNVNGIFKSCDVEVTLE